ncbi:MAG: DMT family transporter [Mangrovicoccus sp.]
MSNLPYALIMLAAGIGVPVLAAMNAQLGMRIGSPAAAALVLFSVAWIMGLVVTLTTGPQALTQAPFQPPHLFLGGLLMAFYVLSVTYIGPKFGIGNAIFFVLLGQLISTAAIDHFGLFGAQVKPLALQRAAGLGLMTMGILLAVRA